MKSIEAILFLVLVTASFGILHKSRELPTVQSRFQSTRQIKVDALKIIGVFKNLQGTNNAETDSFRPSGGLDTIHDMEPAIANQWSDHGIEHIMIYTWPDVFLGFGKNGSAGDPTLNENYNWTLADKYMNFVVSRGVKASINLRETSGTDDTLSSPEILGHIGYMMTHRYVNGAYNSGFKEAFDLIDFYAESDASNSATIDDDYIRLFKYFAAFAYGVNNASTKAGVGAWGGNRILPTQNTNYTTYDPFVSRFYADCKANNVPLGAATYHFTNAQFSFDPHDIVTVTDKFREEILVPAGLPDLPIWVTEYEPNASGLLPNSPSALAAYNDPAFFASFILGTSMYAQDSTVTQILSWTGFGYGGIGAGNAAFQPWFNLSSTGETIPLNVAAAWKLQANLVQNTTQRLLLDGSSNDGFASLAGISENGKLVQVLLNNYQLDYDIVREIAEQTIPLLNTSTTAYPMLQENGLLNGEEACFLPGNSLVYLAICQTFIQATIRNNPSDSYRLVLDNLPWGDACSYEIQIQRVGGGTVLHTVETGNTLDITLAFPANAQDLVSIRKL